MDYKEAVDNEIKGDEEEIKRRKEIWGKIAKSFDQRGESELIATLSSESENTTKEFEKLIEELNKKLK